MAQILTFTIKFNVDPPNVQQALDAINTSLKNVGVSITNVTETAPKINALDDSFTKIGLRLNGMQNLFHIVATSLGSIVAASTIAEASTVKLSQALQNQGLYTDALVAELKSFASARQNATGIDDDATLAIMGQLTAMGLQGQALKDATVAVQDLATLMDGDMNSAVRVVADAFSGNTSMLKRYIKGLDEADIKQRGTISIIEQLQRAIGGQAEAFGNTGAGAIRKFQAALDDFRESMGKALHTVLTPFLVWMSDIVKWLGQLPPSMQAVIVSGTALAAMFAFINSSAGLLPYALGAIGSALLIVINAIKEGNPLIGLPARTSCGGYNCRHSWVPAPGRSAEQKTEVRTGKMLLLMDTNRSREFFRHERMLWVEAQSGKSSAWYLTALPLARAHDGLNQRITNSPSDGLWKPIFRGPGKNNFDHHAEKRLEEGTIASRDDYRRRLSSLINDPNAEVFETRNARDGKLRYIVWDSKTKWMLLLDARGLIETAHRKHITGTQRKKIRALGTIGDFLGRFS